VSLLLSTAGQVLVLVALNPETRVRDIAAQIQVTDRTVMLALSNLVESGLVSVERRGRRNTYKVDLESRIDFGATSIRVGDLVRAAHPGSPGS